MKDSIKRMTKCANGFMRIIVNDEISYTELDNLHSFAKKNFGDKYVIRRQWKNEVEIYPQTNRGRA